MAVDRDHGRDTRGDRGALLVERVVTAVTAIGRDDERARILSLVAETRAAFATGLSCEADRVKAEFAMDLLKGAIIEGRPLHG